MKENKGITLIALVITIIVMLILTGVTIAAVVQGGLLDNARKASFQTAMTKYDEELQAYIAGEKLKAISEGTTYTLPTLTTAAEIKAIIPSFNDKYEGTLVIQNGKIAYKGTTNETEKAWAIEVLGVKENETFVLNQSYATLYLNPNPPSILEMNSEVFDLARTEENGYEGESADGNIYFSTSGSAMWITPANTGNSWGLSTKNFIVSETEPVSANENDYWFKESTSKLYKYVTDTWIEQTDFIIVAHESEMPEVAELGDLIVFTAYSEPMLAEYMDQSNPEMLLVFMNTVEFGETIYCYVRSAEDAIKVNLRFGIEGDGEFKEGWNRITTFNSDTGQPTGTVNINYSDVPSLTNARFDLDPTEFNQMSPYLGYYYSSTPW